MNAISSKTRGAFAVLAVMLMIVVATAPMLQEESDGANATANVNIQPGQTWSWTPTFTSGLTPVVTVSASDSGMPSDSATFSSNSGNASVSNGKVTVNIPSSYAKSEYYVKVKAQTSQPTQIVYYEITFKVASFSLSYSADSVVAKVGTPITNITPSVGGGVTASSYTISGSLPAGMSFSTSTGVISGTPTAYKAQTSYTITATLATTPVQTVSKTISIGAFTDISASDYTVYAIVGETDISVPGVTMPNGTILSSMDLTATKDGSSASVSPGTAYNGMTVAADTGAVSGILSTAGTYVFSETYTATAATGGSTDSRTVTVVAEDRVAISGALSMDSFAGHSDSISLTESAGPFGAVWSIESITKNSTAITSGSDFDSFSISDGTLTSGTGTSAGIYVVTVKLASANTTVNTNGATGAAPADNCSTKEITVTIAEAIEINNARPIYFFEATNRVYDELNLTSNIAGATFSVVSYGDGITSSNISVASDGKVTPGTSALTAGEYTVTIAAQDPINPANSVTETLNVKVVAVLDFANAPSVGIIGE
ncbi:MAG: hypothetical protein E7Z70_01810 [Thermoplasmata archaeon]|nr:hypothetical protein [Thermoplasmata archaeon]